MSETLSYALPEHLQARRAAQRHERTVQIIAVVTMLACFAGAVLLLRPINEMRKEHELIINPESLEGLPPDIALLGKLGTFRALAIDWAAMRAERLKEEGKNYEAKDLHDIVCALQPRFPQAWVNAAWNMSYNISVTQYSAEERWKWVTNGIDLLRDQGLRYNPKSVTIYKELAWIYWHKVGDIMDDEHRSYRRALALDIEYVLGPPPPAVSDAEYFAWFKRVVDAPRDLDALLASDPVAADLDQRRAALGLSAEELLRFVCKVQHTLRSPSIASLVAESAGAATEEETPPEEALARTILVEEPHADWEQADSEAANSKARYLAALRSKVLREEWKFDLDRMYADMEHYGPIDWRSPFSHALYWSDLGNSEAMNRSQVNVNPGDVMNTARLVIQSLSKLVTRGKVVLEPNFEKPLNSYAEETTDIRFIPRLFDLYFEMSHQIWGEADDYDDAPPRIKLMSYWNGLVTDMQNWIQLLYYAGGDKNLELAEEYYAWLRDNNRHPDGSVQERYKVTLEEFMRDNLVMNMQTHRMAGALIRSQFLRSLKYRSMGEDELSVRAAHLARRAYDYWMNDVVADPNERRKMQPIRVQYRDALIAFMESPQFQPLAKVTLWKRIALKEQQYAYDALRPYFVKLCAEQDPPWSVQKAFPQPPGMDEFRKRNLDYVDTPEGREDIGHGSRSKQ